MVSNQNTSKMESLVSFFHKRRCFIYIFIFHFKLHILLKNNYTKHNVSRLMTILSSQNSLNNIYIYIRQEAFNT